MRSLTLSQKILFTGLVLLGAGTFTQAQDQAQPQALPQGIKVTIDKTGLDPAAIDELALLREIPPILAQLDNPENTAEQRKRLRQQAVRLLRKAARSSKTESQKEYLLALAADMGQEKWDKSQGLWLQKEKVPVDIVIFPGQKGGKLNVYILILQKDLTGRAEKYTAILDKILDSLDPVVEHPSLDKELIDPIRVVDTAYSSTPPQTVMVFPQYPGKTAASNIAILISRNLLAAYFDQLIQPVADKIFVKTTEKMVDASAHLSCFLVHRLTHFLGPVFVSEESEKPVLVSQQLKNYFSPIEEIRAEASSLLSYQVLEKEKLISEEERGRMLYTQVATWVERLRLAPESAASRPYIILFNHLLKNDAILYDISEKKIRLDLDNLQSAALKLYRRLEQIESSGNYTDAAQFMTQEKSIKPSPELLELLKQLVDLPADIQVAGFSDQ